MIPLFLLHVLPIETLAVYRVPDSIAIKRIDAEQTNKVWLLGQRSGDSMRSLWLWDLDNNTLRAAGISGKFLISASVGAGRVAVTSALKTQEIYLLDASSLSVDTLHLDTTGCPKYTPSIASPLGSERVILYTIRNVGGYPSLLHIYDQNKGYITSCMLLDAYAREGSLDEFFFISHQIDVLGGRLYAISNYSPFVFVYDTAGKLLRRFGETPEGYRVALPLAPDISFNPEFSREHGRLILDSSDVYQRIYASSDMIFVCFSRGKEKNTQVYDTAGNYIGILDFWPDAVDTSGNIYSLEGRVIRVIKLEK